MRLLMRRLIRAMQQNLLLQEYQMVSSPILDFEALQVKSPARNSKQGSNEMLIGTTQ